MKWLIASDLHGSLYYTKLLFEKYQNEKADRMLLLGDLLYHGPRNDLPMDYNPKKVIDLLNSQKNQIICVRGNCDAEVDQMVLEFPIMADYALLSVGKHMILATHGHVYNSKNVPFLQKGDILLHGHTHIPACEEMEDFIYMNPGSVSLPKDNSQPGYIILEDNTFIWKDMNGNMIKKYELKD